MRLCVCVGGGGGGGGGVSGRVATMITLLHINILDQTEVAIFFSFFCSVP